MFKPRSLILNRQKDTVFPLRVKSFFLLETAPHLTKQKTCHARNTIFAPIWIARPGVQAELKKE
jgi:hypothetical protein